MQLNSVIFPAPQCSYSIKDFANELVYIPKQHTPSLLPNTSRQ